MKKTINSDSTLSVLSFVNISLLAIINILLAGYVWMFLWNNIVAQIFSLVTLSFAEALAISLFTDFVVVDHNAQRPDDKGVTETFAYSIGIKLGYLLIGVILVLLLF